MKIRKKGHQNFGHWIFLDGCSQVNTKFGHWIWALPSGAQVDVAMEIPSMGTGVAVVDVVMVIPSAQKGTGYYHNYIQCPKNGCSLENQTTSKFNHPYFFYFLIKMDEILRMGAILVQDLSHLLGTGLA